MLWSGPLRRGSFLSGSAGWTSRVKKGIDVEELRDLCNPCACQACFVQSLHSWELDRGPVDVAPGKGLAEPCVQALCDQVTKSRWPLTWGPQGVPGSLQIRPGAYCFADCWPSSKRGDKTESLAPLQFSWPTFRWRLRHSAQSPVI